MEIQERCLEKLKLDRFLERLSRFIRGMCVCMCVGVCGCVCVCVCCGALLSIQFNESSISANFDRLFS